MLVSSDPGVAPRRVLPRRVIAPHRRWMPRKQSSRQRNRLPGSTVLYNQAHRGVPGMQQPIRPHSTSARAPGRYSRDPATRPPCWPPTLDQTVRGFKFFFLGPSEEVPHCTTSCWGDPYGAVRVDPPLGGSERPTTSRFGTFSPPTCCPETSPS